MINKIKKESSKPGVLIFALFFLFPAAGQACSVCFTGKEGSVMGLYVATGLLLSLPLILGGGVFLYVRKKYKEREIEEAETTI